MLQRPHRLQDAVLELVPHFPFLELPLDTVPTPDRACPPDTEPVLVTEPSLDTECPPDTDPSVAHTDTAPVPAAPTSHPVPEQPPAAIPSRDRDTEGLRAVPSQAQPPGPVPTAVPEPMPAVLAQDEALVPAEPGALRYLQQHHQDVLGSIPDVSLLPLETGDISAFRVSCRQGCGKVQAGVGRCRQGCGKVQTGVGRCEQVQTGVGRYRQV